MAFLKPRTSDASDSSGDAAATVVGGAIASEVLELLDDTPPAPRYPTRTAARARTLDGIARCARQDARDSSCESGDDDEALRDYSLPTGTRRLLEEERVWQSVLLLTWPEWAGKGDDASYSTALRLFRATWTPPAGVRPPAEDYILKDLIPHWREVYDTASEKTPFDLLSNCNKESDHQALVCVICQLVDGKPPPADLTAQTARTLSSVPLPLTEEALRAHNGHLQPLAKLIDGDCGQGTVADSLSSTSSTACSDTAETAARAEAVACLVHPDLTNFKWEDTIPDRYQQAIRDEQYRFISNADLSADFEQAHIIPKRPRKSPLVMALKIDALLLSGSTPPGFSLNHSSNLLPMYEPEHTKYDRDYTTIAPIRESLEVLKKIVVADEEKRLVQGEEMMPEPWRAWLDDENNSFFPLKVNLIVLHDNPKPLVPMVVYAHNQPDGDDDMRAGTLYYPRADGHFRDFGKSPLPPQTVTRRSDKRHYHPNPFLLVISTAVKIILHPNRPLPLAFKEDLLLCVDIFVLLFRNLPKLSLLDTANPLLRALAAASHEYATPKKKRGRPAALVAAEYARGVTLDLPAGRSAAEGAAADGAGDGESEVNGMAAKMGTLSLTAQ